MTDERGSFRLYPEAPFNYALPGHNPDADNDGYLDNWEADNSSIGAGARRSPGFLTRESRLADHTGKLAHERVPTDNHGVRACNVFST